MYRHRFSTLFVAPFLLLTACQHVEERVSSARSPGTAQQNTAVLPRVVAAEPGIELGYAWDSQQGRVLPNRCVAFAPIEHTAQTISSKVSEITDKMDIARSLDMSASASLKTAFASGSAHAKVVRESQLSSENHTLMVHARVVNGELSAGPPGRGYNARTAYPPTQGYRYRLPPQTPPDPLNDQLQLTKWAQELPEDEFRRKCGDSYISKIATGADAVALLSFSARSEEHRSQVTAALKAKYMGAKLSTDAKTKSDDQLKNTDLELTFMQIGGAGGLLPTSEEDFETTLATLPIQAQSAPRFLTMTLTPYPDKEHPGPIEPLFDAIADYYWNLSYVAGELQRVMHRYAMGVALWQYHHSGYYYRNWLPWDSSAPDPYLQQLTLVENVRGLIHEVIQNHFDPARAETTRATLPKPPQPLPAPKTYRVFYRWPAEPMTVPEKALDLRFLGFLQELMPPGLQSPEAVRLVLPAPESACPPTQYVTTGYRMWLKAVGELPPLVRRCKPPRDANYDAWVRAALTVQHHIMPSAEARCADDPNDPMCIVFEDEIEWQLLKFVVDYVAEK